MKRKLSSALTLALAMALVPAVASADKSSDDLFKEGEEQYQQGNFDAAIKAFLEAYRIEPKATRKPVYLYNIAQAYRQMKNCTKAQFFFKRFLEERDRDTTKPLSQKTREDVELRIRELEDCARAEAAVRPPGEEKDPLAPDPKPVDPKPTDVAVKPTPETETEVVETADPVGPQVVTAHFVGGGAVVRAGDLNIPLQATMALTAGYPIRLNDKLTVAAGAGFTLTPVPYVNMVTNENRTAGLTSVFANGGVTFAAVDKLDVRGDVGAGVLVFSGVSGSPFTKGAPTTGPLVMPHVRVALSADYQITPNFIATATPIAFSFSPPKEGLREDIKSITAIDFMIGLGYRM